MAERASSARPHTPRALTIAGSDSGGGAGIQADLKAFARCGVHGCSAIVAITAQNTLGVSAIHQVPPEVVLAQVRAVTSDIGVDAVKVGMLGDARTIQAVVEALDELPSGTPVVVDPVMVAESGAQLLDPAVQGLFVAEILPRATVLTPNLPEARALLRRGEKEGARTLAGDLTGDSAGERTPEAAPSPADGEDWYEARALVLGVLALGPRAVVLTGGHRETTTDLYLDPHLAGDVVEIPGERHPDGAAHGSGCTHSSVLAAQLALGLDPLQAARVARRLAGEAVRDGLRDVGEGAGPVDVLGLGRPR